VKIVGELANAIQTTEGYKSNKRKESEVIDSVCDILYEIFMMASIHNVNLDKEYLKVLKQLEKRTREPDSLTNKLPKALRSEDLSMEFLN
jgi:NTP pyrophosphatase (non-canonical NTP hydrolase)